MKKLEGKVAFVTGGSRGIGAAIVRHLVGEGARVAFTYSSSKEKAEEVVKKAGGKVLALHADSANPSDIVKAIQRVVKELGPIDILVNNAGIGKWSPIDTFTLADFDEMFAINVRAVFVAIQETAREMKKGGRIINIGSSNAVRVPTQNSAVYSMTKSALIGLVKGLSHDLGEREITVNNIDPGPIDTDMNPATGEHAETVKAFLALPRYGTVDEVAGFVVYLASQEAGYITGANLAIDGGFTA